MHHPVRVVLADDHPMVRRGLRLILGQSPDIEVVAEAGDGHELIEVADRLHADVAVVDLDMPGVDGFQAVRELRARHPDLHCLVLTVHDETSFMQRAAVAGATGYLLKTELDEGLIRGVMTVAGGGAALHPAVTEYLVRQLAGVPDGRDDDQRALSPREQEVLQALADGRSTRQIAADLGIGPQTVKTHIGHIYSKMGLNDRTHAVASGMRQGLVR